jgi:hypothetical protein
MELPPEVLLNSINDFCILCFKDSRHDENAPPHFYVTFPTKDEFSLIICIITSQVAKREDYYKATNSKALEALIYIDNNTFNFLYKKSVIDCNKAELITKNKLKKYIHSSAPCKMAAQTIPIPLKQEIVNAIIHSPLVPPETVQWVENKNKETNS